MPRASTLALCMPEEHECNRLGGKRLHPVLFHSSSSRRQRETHILYIELVLLFSSKATEATIIVYLPEEHRQVISLLRTGDDHGSL
jgi:hypothetical protein